MKTQKVARFLAVAASIGILAVYGCGGGGGGGSTSQSTGTKSASAGATSAQQAVMLSMIGLSSLASGTAAAPKMSKVGGINALIASFTKDLNSYRAKAAAFAPTTTAVTCNVSGSGSATYDVSSDLTTFDITATYVKCINTDTATNVTEYQDGAVSISFSQTTFSFQATNYIDHKTRATDGLLLSEDIADFTMSGTSSGTPLSCGTSTLEPLFILTMNGTISNKEDTNTDGTLDIDQSAQITSLSETVLINTLDNTCNPTDSTITMSGGISLTNNIQANDSISLSIATGNPVTINAATVTGGENITTSGTFSLSSSCFTGSLTIATPTAVFYPTGSENPTSGTIVITGDISGTVTFTAAGDVQIDEGSDGTVDKTYPSGTPIETCVG